MFRCQVALFITCLMSKSILSSLQDPWLRVFSQSTLSSNSVNELNLTIKDADSARFFILGDWGGMDWYSSIYSIDFISQFYLTGFLI